MTPPKALTRVAGVGLAVGLSQRIVARPMAMPQGLACLMIATHGSA